MAVATSAGSTGKAGAKVVMLRTADGRTVCERCVVADGPLTRMRGLLGRRSLPAEEGILLVPAPSVHMFFMRFPIDAVFLGRDGTVLKVRENLRPWRVAACKGARSTLELAAGEAARRGIAEGDRIELPERVR